MKLTLRKANALQSSINEAIKALDFNVTVVLNEFEGVEEQINRVREKFFSNKFMRAELYASLYEIRTKVSNANAESGINNLLAALANSEKQINFYSVLASKGPQTELKVLQGQITKNAEMKDDQYGYNRRDVVTQVLSKDEVDTFLKNVSEFKRQKQRLQDTLLELNIKTEIVLSDETVRILEKADII
jgi:hypothetical protein